MKLSREELIEELALHIVEVRELREENEKLRKELKSFSYVERKSESEELEEKLSMEIWDLPLSVSTLTKLTDKVKCKTVRDLVRKTPAEIMKYKGVGSMCVHRVEEVLRVMGLEFGMEI